MTNAHRAYAKVRNETASKERLMVLLFETALRHMRLAAAAFERRDLKTAESSLSRASTIVAELLSTLNKDQAPALFESLSSVYIFVADRLLKARLGRSAALVREAERVFAPIADAFSEAVKQIERAPAQAQASR
jgi:flagellar secretion chaperone FliS